MTESLKEKPFWIIKLGGSIITEDTEFMTPREDVIANVLLLISEFINKFQFLIVHGAGSFGHPLAKSYNLSKGFTNFTQYNGIRLTHEAMINLNSIIVDIGNRIGLNLLSFPPLSSVTTNKGRIEHWDIRPILKSLEQNFVPVTFGDVVFDTNQQFSILSGDQIVPYLASKLHAEKILMLTDVDGVYSKNPKLDSAAHLLNEININDQELMNQIFAIDDNFSDKIRVTGEMGKKLDELVPILESGVETYILSGLNNKYLRSHLERKKSYLGTKITVK